MSEKEMARLRREARRAKKVTRVPAEDPDEVRRRDEAEIDELYYPNSEEPIGGGQRRGPGSE